MSKTEKINRNFLIKKSVFQQGIKYYGIGELPFKLYGVARENGCYRRLPEKIARKVSGGVFDLHCNTAGGRVRFKTDSPYVAVWARMHQMARFTTTGSAGFDMYARKNSETDEEYAGSFIPPNPMRFGYESKIDFEFGGMHEITINMPLYSGVKDMLIGIDKNAVLEAAQPYKIEKPFVYYGSSITQGGCASRPGNSYESIVSRRFDADYINLGFSGNAKGEDSIADYIKDLDMSLFVYDYDHNAPSSEHLEKTHERMFRRVREAKPDLPVIIMSRPKFMLNDDEKRRLQVIKNTYEHAVAAGDGNVYFIDGPTLMAKAGSDGTVDNCHPNDWGFYSMSCALCEVIEKIF